MLPSRVIARVTKQLMADFTPLQEVALAALLKQCENRHAELLLWPRRHFSALRRRVGDLGPPRIARHFSRSSPSSNSGLDKVNRLRNDYNQYYLMEKSCAFGAEGIERSLTHSTRITKMHRSGCAPTYGDGFANLIASVRAHPLGDPLPLSH